MTREEILGLSKMSEGEQGIVLANGMVTLVDSEDYAYLSKQKWNLKKDKGHLYVQLSYNNRKTKHRPLMHRVIMKAQKGQIVDHKNHNGLDNRKCNLRLCTITENNRNCLGKKRISKYKGVIPAKSKNRWLAQLKYNYKTLYLGTYMTQEEAAIAYNNKAKELYGEYACLNKIQAALLAKEGVW